MATDDISLRVGRLEIESPKITKNLKEENPFLSHIQKKNSISKQIPQNKCLCYIQKKKHSVCKRKPNKILREPVLKLSQCHSKSKRIECQQLLIKGKFTMPPLLNTRENLYLHSLVDTCNQLHISSENVKTSDKHTDANDNSKWWKNDVTQEKQNREIASERNATSSCSQQALNPPCDVTIDELASYFETLVHIPKKMSSMAEMMYI